MARPSKLTETVQNLICDALAVGVPKSTAAACANISESTLYGWLEKGEATTRKNKYSEFLEAVKAAETAAELTAMAHWRKEMPRDWRACMAYLERLHPGKYGLGKDQANDDQGPREVYVVRQDEYTEAEWKEIVARTEAGQADAAKQKPAAGE